jgi:hypothetical protein
MVGSHSRTFPLLLTACLVAVACDGGCRIRGTIVAKDGSPLTNCSIELKGPPDALICCNGPVTPPKIDTIFTVAPTTMAYKLTLTCAGFVPAEHPFKYGVDVSPSKPLELGVVTLQPAR